MDDFELRLIALTRGKDGALLMSNSGLVIWADWMSM